MFENTTNFDFDDDIILDTSFKPTTSSTQVFQAPKRICKNVGKADFKKQKCDDLNRVTNITLTKNIGIERQIRIDGFRSSTRVVRRKFPGPAGLLPEIEANNKSILQLLESERLKTNNIDQMPILSQQTNSVFENGPWKEMRKDFYSSSESLIERFNIKWIKLHALKQLLSHKAPFLAAIIQNLDIVDGKIPTINVTLKDATGDIRGTILHSLYEEYSGYFRIGSVLVLKHFGVLSAGYNNHCLTITPNNLISIYCNEVSRKLPIEKNEDIYSDNTTEDSVKKIIIQNYNVNDILKKYNEDTLAYSEEKTNNNKFKNLSRNRSAEIDNRFRPKDKTSSINSNLTIPRINHTLHRNSENLSTVVYSTNSGNHTINKPDLEESSTTSTSSLSLEVPVKKKFNFKKQFGTLNNSETVLNENAAFTKSNKVDGSAHTCDNIIITPNQVCVKPDSKEHVEIWKNLLEGVDTDSLFDDF